LDLIQASGGVEWFVTTSKQKPKKPFSFLQEYKAEKNSANDPHRQLPIAMVDAQLFMVVIILVVFGSLCYWQARNMV